METSAYLRRSGRGRTPKAGRIIFATTAALLVLFILLNAAIAEPAERLALKKASAVASGILNAAIKEVMEEYTGARQEAFASQRISADGSTVLFIDAVGMNRMASRITECAQQRIAALSSEGITLPLGSAIGIPLLNGAGPNITVAIEPLGEIQSRFSSAFEDAGVNQTRYSATLGLSANMELLVFGRSKSVTASVSAPICETLIIGGVPAAYTNVESMEDALNLIPSEAPES